MSARNIFDLCIFLGRITRITQSRPQSIFFFLLTRKFNERNKTTEKYNENPIADLEISLEKTFLVLDLYVIVNVL